MPAAARWDGRGTAQPNDSHCAGFDRLVRTFVDTASGIGVGKDVTHADARRSRPAIAAKVW